MTVLEAIQILQKWNDFPINVESGKHESITMHHESEEHKALQIVVKYSKDKVLGK